MRRRKRRIVSTYPSIKPSYDHIIANWYWFWENEHILSIYICNRGTYPGNWYIFCKFDHIIAAWYIRHGKFPVPGGNDRLPALPVAGSSLLWLATLVQLYLCPVSSVLSMLHSTSYTCKKVVNSRNCSCYTCYTGPKSENLPFFYTMPLRVIMFRYLGRSVL